MQPLKNKPKILDSIIVLKYNAGLMQFGRLNYFNEFYRLASVAMNFYESAHHDYYICEACCIDTFQDFLIAWHMKPRMHLLEIRIFSICHVIVRPTKIFNNLCKVST